MEYLVLRVTIPFEFFQGFQLHVAILTRCREIWPEFGKLFLPEKISLKVRGCKSEIGGFDHTFFVRRPLVLGAPPRDDLLSSLQLLYSNCPILLP